MSDPTEAIRRQMVAQINAVEGSREYLESKYGQVWDTSELQEDFEVLGFLALAVPVGWAAYPACRCTVAPRPLKVPDCPRLASDV